MNPRLLLTAALAAATLTLGACGGGGGGGMPPAPPRLSDSADLRVARLGGLLEHADALRMSSLHARYSLAAGAETIADSYVETVSCSGGRCVAADGTATEVSDLLDLGAGTDLDTIEVALGTRGGFDTATTSGTFEVTETLPVNLLPKGVIAFPGSGITDNLVDKARSLGSPVCRAA